MLNSLESFLIKIAERRNLAAFFKQSVFSSLYKICTWNNNMLFLLPQEYMNEAAEHWGVKVLRVEMWVNCFCFWILTQRLMYNREHFANPFFSVTEINLWYSVTYWSFTGKTERRLSYSYIELLCLLDSYFALRKYPAFVSIAFITVD